MHTAIIIAVGTELLFGQVVNSNAAYISEKLQMLGINVLYHYTVGDNPERLKKLLERASNEAEIVITTGGLGPTQDDLTKEIIADLAERKLVQDAEAFRRLDEIMSSFGIKNYTQNNYKQALLPEGAEIFYNDAGTAPGFAIEAFGNIYIALPGPPREMTKMMERSVIPYLSKKSDAIIYSKVLRFYGIGESALETALLPIIDGQTDPTIATYAKEGECTVRITTKRSTKEEAEATLQAALSRAKQLAGEYLYSEDDKDFPDVIVELLINKGMKLAAAESCTGGLFAGAITSVPGSSAVLDRAFIVYSNEAKIENLGVSRKTLDKYGAVSEPCVQEMALGALSHSCADIAVAITGIAGPGGATMDKPVGTVFFAITGKDRKCVSYERQFRDRGRLVNRQVCVLELCSLIRKYLTN